MHSEALLIHSTDAERLIDAIATKVVDEWRAVQGDSSDEGLVDVSKMAKLAGVSTSTIERLARRDEITSHKIRSRRLYDPAVVLAELGSAENRPSSEPAKEQLDVMTLPLDEAIRWTQRDDIPADVVGRLYERLARRGHDA